MRSFLLAVSAALSAVACGGGAPAPAPAGGPSPASDADCVLQSASAYAPGTVHLRLSSSVEPTHAPIPQTEAERFAFRQLYESLIRLDCRGRVVPGLAASWRSEDARRRWTFRLRDAASFWDGSPVRAADVVASWRPRQGGIGPLAAVGTVVAAAGPELTVLLAEPNRSVPVAFADPALAVVRLMGESRWPMGTGAYWVAEGADAAHFALRPLPGGVRRGDVEVHTGAEDTDSTHDGADLLVTRDPLALGAARRAGARVIPLPWDRVYALRRAQGRAELLRGAREELARAVGTEHARPADRPRWWDGASRCPLLPAPPRRAAGRLLYPAGDLVARRLALFVAEAGWSPGPATAAREAALQAALRPGSGVAAVVPLPLRAYTPCRTLPAAPDSLVALVETRPHVALWSEGLGLGADWDGALRLLGP